MTLNRYRLKHLVSQGNHAAKLTDKLLSSTDKLLGVILLCKEFANAASAMLVTVITVRLYGEGQIALMAGTLVTTFLILIFGEVSPKVIAASKPERFAFFCSYILYPLLKILYPIVILVNLFVLTFVKIFNVKIDFNNNLHAISMDELRSIISEAGQFIPNQHRKILLNLFELERITVDDIMIPHTFVESIDFDLTDEEMAWLQIVPYKGSLPTPVPTDPLIYRWYEIVSVYGTTIKELIHEEFGDGIMSAIDFSMDIQREADPKGDRVNVVLSGKFLSYKTY